MFENSPRICKNCQIQHPIDYFISKNKSNKDIFHRVCKECRYERNRKRYWDNIEDSRKYFRDRAAKTYQKHKSVISERASQSTAKEKKRQYNREYTAQRRTEDQVYKLKMNIRNLIKFCFRKKNHIKKSKTVNILGCSIENFKHHIESQFEEWMNWDNYGLFNGIPGHGWDIDHIIPIVTAKTTEDIITLNHFTNLRPLCSYENRIIKRAGELQIYVQSKR